MSIGCIVYRYKESTIGHNVSGYWWACSVCRTSKQAEISILSRFGDGIDGIIPGIASKASQTKLQRSTANSKMVEVNRCSGHFLSGYGLSIYI